MKNRSYLDAHIHLWEYCLFQSFTDLSKASSFEEVVEMLKSHPLNGWFAGVRLNQETLVEKTLPDKTFLDKSFGFRPVVIVRTCLHLLIMNTAAMKELNQYSPTGIFLESDVFSLLNLLVTKLQLSPRQIVARGLRELENLGIVRAIDMGMDYFKKGFFDKVDYYTTDFRLLDEALGFKIFLDGGLGARTAALTEEYTDDPGNYGVLNYDDQKLLEIIEKVHHKDKPVAVHAIGDRAVDQFLRVIRKSRHPKDRLEHAQYLRLDQLDALAELKIPVCIQPIFSKEIPWAVKRLGPERMKTAYAWNLMLQKGIPLLAGSDAPVDDPNPEVGARVADALEGNQHLDLEKTLELYSVTNWAFYNWEVEETSTGSRERSG
ncbi:MAG: Amidohydrolase 3 [Thermoanaerobacterales bacterium 50_218]|nr:MAG: Amidohydrolase 3 [Thermoanaerobacterales bacterium 50_218]HAA89920.1 amidohydrolase [Peptococcaceae bacterium]